MAKITSRKITGGAKSAGSGKMAKSDASKQVRTTARAVIIQYRKALKDLAKH